MDTHSCFDETWATAREALLEGTKPGDIYTLHYCPSCKRWFVLTDGKENR